MRVSTTAVARPVAVGNRSISYSMCPSKQQVTTTGSSIGSIVDLFNGYNTQDFDDQLATVNAEEQVARKRFEENIIALEAKHRVSLQNKKNANKLFSLPENLNEARANKMNLFLDAKYSNTRTKIVALLKAVG